MIRADLVLSGFREVATLAAGPVPRLGPAMEELGRVEDGAVAIDAGRFVFVGTSRAAAREVRLRSGGRRIEMDGSCAVPGFVDPHTHLLFAGDRSGEVAAKVRGASYLEIARRGGGIFSTVRATRRASTAALFDAAEARLRRMAAWGTTTAEVKSGYALTHAGELRLLSLVPRLARRTGLRLVPTYLGAHAVPPEFAGRPGAYVEEIVGRTLPEVAHGRRARFADVFCEPGFFSPTQASRILTAARELGLGLRVHAEEFRHSGGARLAARLGAASADHLLAATDDDLARLAERGVTATLLPVTPFASLAPAPPRGRDFVEAGVPVALGSDLSPNSWVEGMPVVLAHAVYAARLTPAEALTAATVNAAHSLGLGGAAGTIAVGRDADLAVFPVRSVEEIPYRIGVVPTAVYRQGICLSSR